MAEYNPNVVSASSTGPKLPDGVVDLNSLESSDPVSGCRVFTHYNGPTDELSGLVAGMCVLDPGSSPHPPHQHPEEEFMIVASGHRRNRVRRQDDQGGARRDDVLRGKHDSRIWNTGKVPMTFYFSKWLGK